MATRTLPRNFTANLPTYSVDQLATAYDIAHERALASDPSSPARTRATNLTAAISAEVFGRGFYLRRSTYGGYYYERFRAA